MNGTYAIDGLRPGVAFTVGATARGHAPGTYTSKAGDGRLSLGEAETRQGIDVTLRAGGVAARGRVKDTFGGVVVGAAVAVWLGEGRAGAAAATDEKGEFVVWVDPGSVRVSVRASGYADGSAYGVAPDHFFDLSLLPSSGVVGRVVERPGAAPVAGARVDAISLEGGGRHSAESAEDGTFHIDGLSPGRYHIEAISPGFSGYAKAPVLVGVAETSREVLVELDRSPPVSGRVVEAVTHAPCPGGEVTLHESHLDEYARAPIEPSGAVHFVAVLPGTYAVEIVCEGHARRTDYATITVAERPVEAVTWEVDRGSVARGVVLGWDGNRVANAEVVADPEGRSGSVSTLTDVRGEFALRGLAAGKYSLSASAAASGSDAADILEISAGRDVVGLRVALGRAATIAGTVVDTDGKPAGGVSVIVSGPTSRRVETRDDGSFVATGLTPGGYRLRARTDGLRVGFSSHGPADITVALGETAKTKLVIGSRSGFVEGRVVDAGGGPLPDFFVEAQAGNNAASFNRHGSASSNRVVTDATGHFRIERIGDGENTLRAYRQGGAEGVLSHVKAGTTDVIVKVSSGTLTGVVTGPPGAARQAGPDRFTIHADDDASSVWRVATAYHANGAFTMSELPPGSYTISIDAPEGTGNAKVIITEGARVSVEIALAGRVVVRGAVVWDDNGAPVGDAQISLATKGEDSRYAGASTVTTKRDGRFEFPHASAGTQVISVSPPGRADGVSIELPAQGGDATIRVPRGGPEESVD